MNVLGGALKVTVGVTLQHVMKNTRSLSNDGPAKKRQKLATPTEVPWNTVSSRNSFINKDKTSSSLPHRRPTKREKQIQKRSKQGKDFQIGNLQRL